MTSCHEQSNAVLRLAVAVVALHRGCLALGLAVRIYAHAHLFHALAYVLYVKRVYT